MGSLFGRPSTPSIEEDGPELPWAAAQITAQTAVCAASIVSRNKAHNMLDLLPHHLIQVILDDFVGSTLSTVSRLDVAYCSSGLRPDMLEVIASLRNFKVELHRQDAEKYVCNMHLLNYLRWIASRRCQISTLDVDPICLAEAWNSLQESGIYLPNTTSVEFSHIDSAYACMHGNLYSIAPFLAIFPNLKEFSWSAWNMIGDSTLSQLLHLQCPLEALKLMVCSFPTPACVVEVATHFSATFKCLESCVLDAAALIQLSRVRLPKFERLLIYCECVEMCSALVQFCESVAGTIESLNVILHFPSEQKAFRSHLQLLIIS